MFNNIFYSLNSVKVCTHAGRKVDSRLHSKLFANRTIGFNAVGSPKLFVKV